MPATKIDPAELDQLNDWLRSHKEADNPTLYASVRVMREHLAEAIRKKGKLAVREIERMGLARDHLKAEFEKERKRKPDG